MTEPRDIIKQDDSSNTKSAYIYRTVNDRTLSEEYNANSPATKERIKSMCGTSPTSNYKEPPNAVKPRASIIGRQISNELYKKADETGREIMAHYGMVSSEFHNKNKDA
jgi:hypothetical protein